MGPASGVFKTGRYSKSLPSALSAKYDEARADEELLALRDEIALVDSRIGEVLTHLGTGENGATWTALHAAHKALEEARIAKDSAGMANMLTEIGHLIQAGGQDRQTWAEVVDLLERRRRLVGSEAKRLQLLQQYLTVEGAMTLLAYVLDAIRSQVALHVTDPDEARALRAGISAELKRIVNGEGGGRGPAMLRQRRSS